MSEPREFPEISQKEFDERLIEKMEDVTVIDAIQLSGIYEIMSNLHNEEILEDYKEDMEPETNYEMEVKNFKIDILPSIINMFGPNDTVAMCEAWSNWVDALCKGGKITKYQRKNWENPF